MNAARGPRRDRRGFTLLLVIASIAVLLSFWAMAFRSTSSLIRVESTRALRRARSIGAVHAMTALDRALTLLELTKPTTRQAYAYSLELALADGSHRFYTITFTPNDSLAGASNGWTVSVASGSPRAHLALPSPGDDPQWPASPPS